MCFSSGSIQHLLRLYAISRPFGRLPLRPSSPHSQDKDLPRSKIQEVLFADDCTLVAHAEAGLQLTLNRFSDVSKLFGLTISLSKTELENFRVTNLEVLDRAHSSSTESMLIIAQLRWVVGHVIRIGEHRLPSRLLYGEFLHGKRNQAVQRSDTKTL